MSDDKEFFVNRHGKKMSADDAPIEAPVTESIYIAPVKTTKKKKRRGKRPVKKIFVLVMIILLGAVLIPLIGGELVRARYLSSRDGAKAQLIEYATKTVVPQQKKNTTVAQVSEAADKVEKIRDDACDGGFTDNLATIYPRAKTAFDQCIALKQKIAAIAVSLRDMESQARYLESLTPVLQPVSKSVTDDFAVISAQLSNWQALHEALGKLSPAASQRATHDQLKAQAKTIVDAWSALNTAYDNQDAAAFAAAEKKLGESYETFRSSSVALSKVLNDTQASLTQNYQAL